MLSLLKNIDEYDIILASQSPRRYQLLTMVGFDFKVRPSNVPEVYVDGLEPLEYAKKNAEAKGRAVAEQFPESLVISADTIVVYKEHILEKPTDEQHAAQILKQLAGHTHTVITAFGIHLLRANKILIDHEISQVTFRNLSPEEIRAYIDTGEPMDKAGGYGAQGMGSLLIKKVDGCFYNVVGLPLARFFYRLDKFLSEL
jgi:septum formation protein